MATIKLAGLKAGTTSTIGSSDDAVIDGTISSNLSPTTTETYDLGSPSKKWRNGYFDQVLFKQRHINTAKFASTNTNLQFVRWDTTGSNNTAGVNNKFLAPCDGSLLTVVIRCTTSANGTNIAFHKSSNGTANLNSTATETIGVDISANNTAFQANFTNSTFSAGDILGISIDPSNAPNDVNITCVWIFDWNS